MPRIPLRRLGHEVRLCTAIIVQLVFGFLAGLLLLGLVPGDSVNFNVIGSLIMAVPCTGAFLAATWYRRNLASA
jgi:hypothetical protein